MEYVALLRGTDVDGKNKVVMNELYELITRAGFTSVRSYINSGNLLFESDAPAEDVAQVVEDILERNYDSPIRLAILTGGGCLAELSDLPSRWHDDIARRDALFYTRDLDRDHVHKRIEAMEPGDEAVHFGESAVFWGKFDEKEFLKTAYHKHLLREDFYYQVTIRSGATVEKIAAMLSQC